MGIERKMDFIVDAANQTQQNQTVEFADMNVGKANIKVIGCGGAGGNMTNWLYKKGIDGAEIIACNTDLQHINIVEADRKFLLGKERGALKFKAKIID